MPLYFSYVSVEYPHMIRRREYLVGFAAVLAGCSTSADQPTDTPTTTSTETPIATPTETSTATEEPTPTGEQAREHIENAIDEIHASINAYVGFGGPNTAFSEIDATVASYNYATVTSPLDSADRELERARDHAIDDQQATIDSLDEASTFMRAVGEGQAHLIACYDAVQGVADAAHEGDAAVLKDAASALGDDLDGARNQATIASETDASAMASISLDEDAHAAKIAQFQTAVDAFTAFDAALSHLPETVETFYDGANEYYVEENYVAASSRFWTAENGYEDVRDAWSEPETIPDYLTQDVDDLACYIGVMPDAANKLYKAAERDGNSSYREQAEERLAECDVEGPWSA